MKKALLILAVLLTASCGYFDDSYTKEITPADGTDPWNERAQAWISEDQRRVELTATGGACDESAEIRVSESATKVRIVLRVTANEGPCVMIALARRFPVELRNPLGDRALVGGDDRAYPRLTGQPRYSVSQYDIPVRVIHDD